MWRGCVCARGINFNLLTLIQLFLSHSFISFKIHSYSLLSCVRMNVSVSVWIEKTDQNVILTLCVCIWMGGGPKLPKQHDCKLTPAQARYGRDTPLFLKWWCNATAYLARTHTHIKRAPFQMQIFLPPSLLTHWILERETDLLMNGSKGVCEFTIQTFCTHTVCALQWETVTNNGWLSHFVGRLGHGRLGSVILQMN